MIMWLVIIGVIALILGLLYFFKPELVKKIDEFGKNVVVNTETLVKHHKKIGLFCAVVGAILIYLGLLIGK